MKNENELLQEAYELYQAQMPGACLAVCEEIKARPDHSAEAHYYAGVACIHLGRVNQAVSDLEEAVRREPKNDHYYSVLASAYERKAFKRVKQKQALREASRLRAETAPEWQRQMTYGKLAETEGRWERALLCYRLALSGALDPQFVQTYIGRALSGLGRWAEARDVMRDVVTHPATEPTAWFVLGRSEWKLGNREAAAAAFERATTLYPYNQRAWFHLSKVSFARGHWRAGFRQSGMMWRLLYQTAVQEEAAAMKSKPKKSTPKG